MEYFVKGTEKQNPKKIYIDIYVYQNRYKFKINLKNVLKINDDVEVD